MPSFDLGHLEKQSIQFFMEEVQMLEKDKFSSFVATFPHGNEASWRRFVKGAYNHPITWWIGILQLQMQTGVWGHHYQAIANSRASELWQISKPLRSEATGLIKGEDAPMLSAIVRFNWNHRKADILGRMLGSKFTNYASTGGRMGRKRISKGTIYSVNITNVAISSYGAAIKALVEGKTGLEEVVQSILTGSADNLPKNYNSKKIKAKPSEEEKDLLNGLKSTLDGIMYMSQINSAPVPIKEFCLKPENINLKGLCK